MAKIKLVPPITIEEALLAQMYSLNALIKVLIKKKLITETELFEEIKKTSPSAKLPPNIH
ncbi:MAG: hypothetical protein PHE88_12005 [Elusimicrobia bacterium]|nr:hypothetical protein [Elusimicrobiota bacterium]